MTGDPEPGQWGMRWAIPDQTRDDRPDSEVCGCCVKSLLPRRAVYKHRLPICRACDSMPNHPVLLNWWLDLPRAKKRAWITACYGIDPADKSFAEVEAEYSEVVEDVDGIPAGVNVRTGNTAFGAGKLILPVKTFWDIWTRKPRATHHDS